MPLPVILVVKKGSKARLERVLVHADAAVADRKRDHRAALRVGDAARCGSSSTPPSGIASRALTAMLSKADSSWARSASTVQASAARLGAHLDPLAERAVEQVGHAADQLVDVDHLGLERLAAGEGEQLAGQRRGAARGLDHRLGEADPLVLGEPGPAQHVGRALDDGQQIVEIVGDAAGELAERLHLVRLAQLLLGLAALADLDLELGIGVGQRVGALLELAVGAAQRVWAMPSTTTTSAAMTTSRPITR